MDTNNTLMISVKLKQRHQDQKRISPIFLSNGLSSTVIIPIDLARKYSIDRPSNVTIEDTQNGLLIRKLEVN